MPRVAVIVPAYNAAGTLAETLASASAQSLRDIEILVVSDGSTDATVDIASRARETDPRIRVIEQANSGVAAARNTGIAASDSAFIAPLDADDLWHPDKLKLQLARFDACDTRTGLVYNWYRAIDAASRVLWSAARPGLEGYVLHQHLVWNFVGNGSTPLIRREALAGRGYDPELAARDAGGCEDYLLQLQIAREWHFACVPAHLTGYRQGVGSMSGNRLTMLRSYQATYNRMRGAVGYAGRKLCDRGFAKAKVLEASHLAGRGRQRSAAAAYVAALLNAPKKTVAQTVAQARTLRRETAPADAAEFGHYSDADPFAFAHTWEPNDELRRAGVFDLQAR